jgi:hypothetical protein
MFTAATFSMLLTINADAFPAALQNPFLRWQTAWKIYA